MRDPTVPRRRHLENQRLAPSIVGVDPVHPDDDNAWAGLDELVRSCATIPGS
jgi:hypothetical protein